jgi:hypothetical protein
MNSWTGDLSGEITGKIDQNGYKVWFAEDLSNPDAVNQRWGILPPQGYIAPYDGIIPPEFLGSAALQKGVPTSSADGEIITLIFEGKYASYEDAVGIMDGGQLYSLTLNPSAFRGADSGKLLASTRTVNFRVEAPSLTNYIKHEIEKVKYGSISVEWVDFQGSDIEEYLRDSNKLDGVVSNVNVTYKQLMEAAYGGPPPESDGYFPGAGEGATEFSTENVKVVSQQDLSKGYWLGTIVLQLGAINAAPEDGDPDSAPVQISVQLQLTSVVGNAIAALKKAEAEGKFKASTITSTPAGSEAMWGLIMSYITGITTVTEKSTPLPPKSIKTNYKVDIALEEPDDDSPAGVVSIIVSP